jgi:hypothetical protein
VCRWFNSALGHQISRDAKRIAKSVQTFCSALGHQISAEAALATDVKIRHEQFTLGRISRYATRTAHQIDQRAHSSGRIGVGGESIAEAAQVDEFKVGQITRKNWQVLIAGEQDFGGDVALILRVRKAAPSPARIELQEAAKRSWDDRRDRRPVSIPIPHG